MQEKNYKLFLFPMVAFVMFTLLIFAAGYAYFNGSTTMATSNYQVNLPQTTSLICTKTDCSVTVTPAQMISTNTNATTAKATSNCAVACTCSGSQGATCNYNVSLLESGMPYITSGSLGTNNEFTVKVTSPTGCTAQNTSSTANQVNNMMEKVVSNCSLTVPSSGSTSATVYAEFKWYNLNLDQTLHALKNYKYQLVTSDMLPSEYQRVEYIQNSGVEYIDTNYYTDFSKNLNIEIVSSISATGKRYCLLSNYSSNVNLSLEIYSDNKGRLYYNGNPDAKVGTYAANTKTVYLMDYNATSKTYRLTIGSTTQTGTLNGSGVANKSLLLFVDQSQRFSTFSSPMKIYSVKISENGEMKRNMIPCKRISDNVTGMYDIVNGVFYSDPGNHNFAVGSNV